ncbi:MAG TPA: quinolinate synthase NadA [Dehalococcoidales bacterium]|nr:quinolinate synthase NadA [Dehalococcoidales bacterium]
MLDRDQPLLEKIQQLKKKRNAVFLVHNYQLGEVQDVADFVGDSLELSQKAAKTAADVIVFCGVHFMAETASILCPDKIVLLPESHAGCPMANMITAPRLREKKKEYPNAMVVCYVNTPAAVKAESDICCTSANAVKIVQNIPAEQEIMFVPDQYLGGYVASQTGRKMILWPGYCPTHARILAKDIIRLKSEYPNAKVLAHPECRPEVHALADAVLSTGGIIRFARESEAKELIIGTEIGILHRLKKENPDKKFIPVTEQAVCPRMKLTTLESISWSLENMTHQVKVPERIREKALAPINRMLEQS